MPSTSPSLTSSTLFSPRNIAQSVRTLFDQILPISRHSYSTLTPATASATSNGTTSSSSFRALLPPPAPTDATRLCVVVDMDETLVHSRFEASDSDYFAGDISTNIKLTPPIEPFIHPTQKFEYDFTFICGKGSDADRVFVSLRPYLREFLSTITRLYEPILFTSALPIYAKPVLDYIEKHFFTSLPSPPNPSSSSPPPPPPLGFRHRCYRDATVKWKNFPYVKDIRHLNRPLHRCVLIDNSPFACVATPDNSIVVKDWTGGLGERLSEKEEITQRLYNLDVDHYIQTHKLKIYEDKTLLHVLELLEKLDKQTRGNSTDVGRQEKDINDGTRDVRPLLKEIFKLKNFFPGVKWD